MSALEYSLAPDLERQLHDDDLLELYACDELPPLCRARVAIRLRLDPALRERLAVISALTDRPTHPS